MTCNYEPGSSSSSSYSRSYSSHTSNSSPSLGHSSGRISHIPGISNSGSFRSSRMHGIDNNHGRSYSFGTPGRAGSFGSVGNSGSFSTMSETRPFRIPGISRTVNYQPVSTSSRHEVNEQKKFINGQQVYDLHHERRFKDGNLIHDDRSEKNEDDISGGPYVPRPVAEPYVNRQSSMHRGENSHNIEENSQNLFPNVMTNTAKEQSMYHQSTSESGFSGSEGYYKPSMNKLENNKELSHELNSEIQNLRNTLSHYPYNNYHPQPGGVHRTEYRTETRYVNGQPVFTRKQERKYKDGQLIHDNVQESGPETTDTSEITSRHTSDYENRGSHYSRGQINHGSDLQTQTVQRPVYSTYTQKQNRSYVNEQFIPAVRSEYATNQRVIDSTYAKETQNQNPGRIHSSSSQHLEESRTSHSLPVVSESQSISTNAKKETIEYPSVPDKQVPISSSYRPTNYGIEMKFKVGENNEMHRSNSSSSVHNDKILIRPGVQNQGRAQTFWINLTNSSSTNQHIPIKNNPNNLNLGVHTSSNIEVSGTPNPGDKKRYDINPYEGYTDLSDDSREFVDTGKLDQPVSSQQTSQSTVDRHQTKLIIPQVLTTQEQKTTNVQNQEIGQSEHHSRINVNTGSSLQSGITNDYGNQYISRGSVRPVTPYPHLAGNAILQKIHEATNTSTTHVLPITHQYRHVIRKEKKFVNGQQVHESTHERHFKDGDLIHENKTEHNPNFFNSSNLGSGTQFIHGQEMDSHSFTEGSSLHNSNNHGSVNIPSDITRTYAYQRRHQEKYENNDKVYDLNHERVFEDGVLVHENKTELGPDKLLPSGHRDALLELMARNHSIGPTANNYPIQTNMQLPKLHSSVAQHQTSNFEQSSSSHVSKCPTCVYTSGDGSSKASSIQAAQTLGNRISNEGTVKTEPYWYSYGYAYEQHSNNGELQYGKEEEKHWQNGDLVKHNSRVFPGEHGEVNW